MFCTEDEADSGLNYDDYKKLYQMNKGPESRPFDSPARSHRKRSRTTDHDGAEDADAPNQKGGLVLIGKPKP